MVHSVIPYLYCATVVSASRHIIRARLEMIAIRALELGTRCHRVTVGT